MKKRGKTISFPDDTVLTYDHHTWVGVKTADENDVELIKHWFKANELTVNLIKTLTFADIKQAYRTYDLPTYLSKRRTIQCIQGYGYTSTLYPIFLEEDAQT